MLEIYYVFKRKLELMYGSKLCYENDYIIVIYFPMTYIRYNTSSV